MCRRSSAPVTRLKYECETNNLTVSFTRRKYSLAKKLTNGTLVTSTPAIRPCYHLKIWAFFVWSSAWEYLRSMYTKKHIRVCFIPNGYTMYTHQSVGCWSLESRIWIYMSSYILCVIVNNWLLTECVIVIPYGVGDLGQHCSGNGLVPSGNKSLPEKRWPIMHLRFYNFRNEFIKWIWKLHFKIYNCIYHVPWVN